MYSGVLQIYLSYIYMTSPLLPTFFSRSTFSFILPHEYAQARIKKRLCTLNTSYCHKTEAYLKHGEVCGDLL